MAVTKTVKNQELTDKISAEKNKPKGPIKFKMQLNEEQKEAKRVILSNDITVVLGNAGSGKTLVSCQVALDMLFKREVKKIVIARPTVTSGEDIGFLPGTMQDKLDPFLQPIYDNMFQLYDKAKIEKLLADNIIEIIPFAFMRGRTMTQSFVILDEAQNVTDKQMSMAIGRLGMGSKMAICGDTAQIDLKTKKQSGLAFLRRVEEKVEGFKILTLKQNHRHPIVEKVLEVYDEYED